MNPIIKIEIRKDSNGENIVAFYRQRMDGKCKYYTLTFPSTIRLLHDLDLDWQVTHIDAANIWLVAYPPLTYRR